MGLFWQIITPGEECKGNEFGSVVTKKDKIRNEHVRGLVKVAPCSDKEDHRVKAKVLKMKRRDKLSTN